jgi:uncharacterized protein involved in type VI secretion and phage assembly
MSEHERLVERLARELERRRFGKYRGFVADNADPELRGRLKLRVPSVYGLETSDWALPCVPFGGAPGHGLYLLPEPDDMVWAEFEEGDIDRPIWSGCSFPAGSEVPEPGKRTLLTPKGHCIELVDVDDAEAVVITHAGGAKLEIDPKGTILLEDQSGGSVTLDAENEAIVLTDKHGNTFSMSADGITIEDANGNKLVMGSSGIALEDANGNKLAMESSGVAIEGTAVDIA